MQRFVYFSLFLLIILAFFFGLNLGKRVQEIDTPVKTKIAITKIMVTRIVTPTVTVTIPVTKAP
ncbi:hypothetical protein A2313_02800 [Candidatus Roizmanbacteria bacterium RIFOXYB2_FULL_41_10]|uniref:Uncharacterized protein n=1 Tax=Candidatus Roizmanbacteria bacterium RIFOXYA1_FULL_41_12 TaxID=1802082 RepID=A0A1F7KAU5_9BACT|nr:MAG: hypothetical protein A2209_04825 [Candidatus Roizmanbacteria bacterium RIFOXYA1_FULL_41_12]OGK66754.1 MAG: hypothetical protein A2377_02495 [Candidatus Roizmanbacteria bacterium RIFOXYB1_FULL_41_27]OGK67313.1 MAG: hypothetical protein A2262_03965 [Candidatus Roizmanbacteria bacterium RIFOXYA2_FULL_41_8]OGK70665.1 MAG: hypothetical protein A2313_02800 [Candidatus Roizmanbacteria bacterium RIFOXYB2_FULL_41_10]OGK70872.1 MAG: hypothetical protein A2403_02210 [Candidatus Roizmanbacteria bac